MILKEFQEIRDRLHALREKTGVQASIDTMLDLLKGVESRWNFTHPAVTEVPLLHPATTLTAISKPVLTTLHPGLTTDPNDPRLTHGADDGPVEQNKVYLVLSKEERDKGFVRPLHRAYRHTFCGTTTTMGSLDLCETYARNPKFYSHTYCCACRRHLPVAEFTWTDDNTEVGS